MSAWSATSTTLVCGRAVAVVLVAAGAVGVVAGCADQGAISVMNEADEVVSVRSGGDDVFRDVDPGGGGGFFSGDCLAAPLVVTYAGGSETVVEAPLCPGQVLLVTADRVSVVASSSS